tara:strand:- start:2311 stop:2592 length:282 start_codon:yes stop_codon:yes gene_type:complete
MTNAQKTFKSLYPIIKEVVFLVGAVLYFLIALRINPVVQDLNAIRERERANKSVFEQFRDDNEADHKAFGLELTTIKNIQIEIARELGIKIEY